MQHTFDLFWDYARWVVKWTNSLLVPPTPQILQLMGAASQMPSLARKIANGFNHPPDYFPWWFDPAEADSMIKRAKSPHLMETARSSTGAPGTERVTAH